MPGRPPAGRAYATRESLSFESCKAGVGWRCAKVWVRWGAYCQLSVPGGGKQERLKGQRRPATRGSLSYPLPVRVRALRCAYACRERTTKNSRIAVAGPQRSIALMSLIVVPVSAPPLKEDGSASLEKADSVSVARGG